MRAEIVDEDGVEELDRDVAGELDRQSLLERVDGARVDDSDEVRFSRLVETPEFERWFGESQVVDADGRPLVLYHGTSAYDDFSAFNTVSDNELGSHFGTVDPASADIRFSRMTDRRVPIIALDEIAADVRSPFVVSRRADVELLGLPLDDPMRLRALAATASPYRRGEIDERHIIVEHDGTLIPVQFVLGSGGRSVRRVTALAQREAPVGPSQRGEGDAGVAGRIARLLREASGIDPDVVDGVRALLRALHGRAGTLPRRLHGASTGTAYFAIPWLPLPLQFRVADHAAGARAVVSGHGNQIVDLRLDTLPRRDAAAIAAASEQLLDRIMPKASDVRYSRLDADPQDPGPLQAIERSTGIADTSPPTTTKAARHAVLRAREIGSRAMTVLQSRLRHRDERIDDVRRQLVDTLNTVNKSIRGKYLHAVKNTTTVEGLLDQLERIELDLGRSLFRRAANRLKKLGPKLANAKELPQEARATIRRELDAAAALVGGPPTSEGAAARSCSTTPTTTRRARIASGSTWTRHSRPGRKRAMSSDA